MQIALVSSASTSCCHVSYTRGIPSSLAARSPDSRVRLVTLTISTPACARSFGMWYLPVFAPAPTTPTRSVPVSLLTMSSPRARAACGSRPLALRQDGEYHPDRSVSTCSAREAPSARTPFWWRSSEGDRQHGEPP